MNRLLLAIGVAALFTTASYAEKNVSGAYIGAGYGHTEYQDDDFRILRDQRPCGQILQIP